jgi:hypothetical protein
MCDEAMHRVKTYRSIGDTSFDKFPRGGIDPDVSGAVYHTTILDLFKMILVNKSPMLQN